MCIGAITTPPHFTLLTLVHHYDSLLPPPFPTVTDFIAALIKALRILVIFGASKQILDICHLHSKKINSSYLVNFQDV